MKITPATPTTEITTNDVMNLLTGYLFAAMYLPANNQPAPTPADAPRSEKKDALAIESAPRTQPESLSLITQLMQAAMPAQVAGGGVLDGRANAVTHTQELPNSQRQLQPQPMIQSMTATQADSILREPSRLPLQSQLESQLQSQPQSRLQPAQQSEVSSQLRPQQQQPVQPNLQQPAQPLPPSEQGSSKRETEMLQLIKQINVNKNFSNLNNTNTGNAKVELETNTLPFNAAVIQVEPTAVKRVADNRLEKSRDNSFSKRERPSGIEKTERAQMMPSPVNEPETLPWQKPVQEWLSSVNKPEPHLNEKPAIEITQNQQVIIQSEIPLLSETTQPGKADQVTESSSLPTFHLDNIEPLPQQHGVYQLTIRVNPLELGPVHAKLKMSKNKLELMITVKNSATEQAIKLHLPQLTEKFSQSTMRLDVTVQQSASSFEQQEQPTSHQVFDYAPDELTQNMQKKQQADDKKSNTSESLVDTYI